MKSKKKRQWRDKLYCETILHEVVIEELEPVYRSKGKPGHLLDRVSRKTSPPGNDVEMRAGSRWRILDRDGFRCFYCGRSSKDGAVLHVDHIVPRALGGEDSVNNLVTACEGCNLGKSARLCSDEAEVLAEVARRNKVIGLK